MPAPRAGSSMRETEMAAVTHGRAGYSLEQDGGNNASSSRRGAFFERRVAGAINHWLQTRKDTIHVFHDLVGLTNVRGAGLKPVSLGNSNIDHVLLTRHHWIMIDAKGCGAGSLGMDSAGKGILTDTAGQVRSQPWMDDVQAYSRAGILFRLTGGKTGQPVWAIPEDTKFDPHHITESRFLSRGGCILNIDDLAAGALNQLPELSGNALEAEPRDIEHIRQYLSFPGVASV